jgi:hypothetical protein
MPLVCSRTARVEKPWTRWLFNDAFSFALDKRTNVRMTQVDEHEMKRHMTYFIIIFQNQPGGTKLMSSKNNQPTIQVFTQE